MVIQTTSIRCQYATKNSKKDWLRESIIPHDKIHKHRVRPRPIWDAWTCINNNGPERSVGPNTECARAPSPIWVKKNIHPNDATSTRRASIHDRWQATTAAELANRDTELATTTRQDNSGVWGTNRALRFDGTVTGRNAAHFFGHRTGTYQAVCLEACPSRQTARNFDNPRAFLARAACIACKLPWPKTVF